MVTPLPLRLSVVIPARNEAANLAELIPEIVTAARTTAYEIVVVDDGSTDQTATMVEGFAKRGWPARRHAHAQSLGQSAALLSGVTIARGEIILTLDGDGQNDPAALPTFLAKFDDARVGLVAGQRTGRKASMAKSVGSRIANRVRRGFLRDDTRDTGCGIKAFRRDAFLRLPYFQTMHRFLPALFLGDGWQVAHVDVVDRPRRHGTSNYGIFDRLAVSIPDLFGVWWLLRRRRRNPLRAESQIK